MSQSRGLRERVLSGEPCLGPFLKVPDPTVTEIAGLAGFDHVVIDLEHSAFTMDTVVAMVRAASLRGIASVVRVTGANGPEIVRALDTGATGIIVPGVGTAAEAEQVVRHARFHPLGARGMDLYARAAGWGAEPRDDYVAGANERTLVGIMAEGAAAFEHLDAIAEVEGLDLLFIGPYDLSQSVGLPGQVAHPKVLERIDWAIGVARAHGKAIGVYVDDVATAVRYRSRGVSFIGMANDADILRKSFTGLIAAFAASSADGAPVTKEAIDSRDASS